jgi:Domain of unknown function (DUF317)
LEASLYPVSPLDPSPHSGRPAFWVGPRHLAGDDGRLYDTAADTLADLHWTSLTIVRGRHEPDELSEERKVVRSTALHISPDTLRWAQWSLADEPFHLGDLPIAWQISGREDRDSPLAHWSAYFTPDVPGEAMADFLVALDARDQPAVPFGSPESVLDAVAANGWLYDIAQPQTAADLTLTSHITRRVLPEVTRERLLRAPAN